MNALLNAEADAICQASRDQRSPERQGTRAGSDKRKLLTKAGEVELHVPRLRMLPFETQIIEGYKMKQENSGEEALIEMLSGGSVRSARGGYHQRPVVCKGRFQFGWWIKLKNFRPN